MKKIFVTIAILFFIGSSLLHFIYHYPWLVIIYHLIILAAYAVGTYALFRLAGHIRPKNLRRILQNIICFFYFISIAIFYIVTIGSLELWGKAIELNLLASYIPRLNSLIDVLPFQAWILYTSLVVILVLLVIIYYFIRPKTIKNDPVYLKRDVIITGVAIVLLMIFYQPAIMFKRQMYAAGEPVLGFLFPKAWHDPSEMESYKKVLFNDGSADKDCIEAVKQEPVHKSDRNVIIILVDGLRRDFLSVYGYDRETTPYLDSMVKSNSMIRVDYPFSPSTATVSGVANLFSSKNIDDFSFSSLRLMRYMKMKNFNTYAFITGQHSNWYWLANIYKNDCDFFYESKSDLSPNDNDFVMLDKFEHTKLKAPFFGYMHLMSVHIMGKKTDAFRKYQPDKIGIATDKKTALINNYDNGILQVDFVIRKIFQKLERDGQLESSTIFIVADHGELFGEDGRWKHSGSIHPYLQTIPMLIFDKDKSWYKNTFTATLLDVAPTIADRLGYAVPDCWTGVSLHKKLADFDKQFESGVECDLPYGILHNRDSVLTMDLLENDRSRVKSYRNDKGKWIEEKL